MTRIGWRLGLFFLAAVVGGCGRKSDTGKTETKPAEQPARKARAPDPPRAFGPDAASKVEPPARKPETRTDTTPSRARPAGGEAVLKKDLVAYAKKWATLTPLRTQLKVLLRQASAFRAKGQNQPVGDLIKAKVVPGFDRLVKALEKFRPSTGPLKKAHADVVAGYRGMMEAYRLAGRAWRSSGQGVALALKKLKAARMKLKGARRRLAQLASAHKITIR